MIYNIDITNHYMPLIREGETNTAYLMAIIIIAGLLGGGLLIWYTSSPVIEYRDVPFTVIKKQPPEIIINNNFLIQNATSNLPETAEMISPEETIRRGLEWYLSYLNSEDKEKKDSKNPYFSIRLKEKLKGLSGKALPYDPVFFVANGPGFFTTDKAIMLASSAHAIVTLPREKLYYLRADLIREDNVWKIDNTNLTQ